MRPNLEQAPSATQNHGWLRFLVVLPLCLGTCGAAEAQTFTSVAAVTVPDGVASPFPSVISVSGVESFDKVTVEISEFSHTWPGDVGFLLQGPSGVAVPLCVREGGGEDAVGLSLIFDDDATSEVSTPVVSGTFRPSGISSGAVFSSPAPEQPWSSDLSAFHGIPAVGDWKLYVEDFAGSDTGQIAEWSLVFHHGAEGTSIYQSTGALGDLLLANGTESVVFNTGATPPTVQVSGGATLSGRVENGVAVYDFRRVELGRDISVSVVGERPISIAASEDLLTSASLDVSGYVAGRAGGGSGGAGGGGGGAGNGGNGGSGGTGQSGGGAGWPGYNGPGYCASGYSGFGGNSTDGAGGGGGTAGGNGSSGAPGVPGFGYSTLSIDGGTPGSSGASTSGGGGGGRGTPGFYGFGGGGCSGNGGWGSPGGSGAAGSSGSSGNPGNGGASGATPNVTWPTNELDVVAGSGGAGGGGAGGGSGAGGGGGAGSGGSGGGGGAGATNY
ncbi:MAG: proprotein convertase P-domain-containing protein, partial [Gemmatimonadetes bacterium]|nr:proprotein convertase P-domain-containing protein [Gemmatimonadota bacterium]